MFLKIILLNYNILFCIIFTIYMGFFLIYLKNTMIKHVQWSASMHRHDNWYVLFYILYKLPFDFSTTFLKFSLFKFTQTHGFNCVSIKILRNCVIHNDDISQTCSPSAMATAPVVLKWFQLRSKISSLSFSCIPSLRNRALVSSSLLLANISSFSVWFPCYYRKFNGIFSCKDREDVLLC